MEKWWGVIRSGFVGAGMLVCAGIAASEGEGWWTLAFSLLGTSLLALAVLEAIARKS